MIMTIYHSVPFFVLPLTMTTKSLLVLIATLALAYAGGKANQTIGAPCKAGEDAMGLFQSTDLMGKIAIITGSDTGIGKEIARALAARNATVVMAVRKIASAQAAAADIKKDVPHANIVIPEVGIDLSSFNLTRAYAIAANKAIGGRPVHWLINDAAMSNNPHGYEGADLDQNGKPFEMLFEVTAWRGRGERDGVERRWDLYCAVWCELNSATRFSIYGRESKEARGKRGKTGQERGWGAAALSCSVSAVRQTVVWEYVPVRPQLMLLDTAADVVGSLH